MKNSPHYEPASLPGPIVAALNRLIQRTRRLIFLRGLCTSCAAGIGAFLVIMFLDASLTLLSPWPRWIMSILAYSIWVAATAWFLIRPLTHSYTLTGIARLIEIHHPELQERISSAVQLISSKDIPSIRGSETLIAALTEEAIREVGTIQPKQEISFRSAVPFVVAAGVVLGVLAILCLGWPRETRFLLARATAPFLNLPNVQAFDLVVEPGNTLVAAGSTMQISLRTANAAVTTARLRQEDRQGRETVTTMLAQPAATNQPGRRFSVTLPDVQAGFRYRVHAGDALSQYFTVRVAIPPVITHLNFNYRYPEYSRLATKQERDGSGTIRALVGTTVSLTAQVNKPARSATFLISTPTMTNILSGILRTIGKDVFYDFSLTLPKGLNGGWTIKLIDEINLMNTPFEHPIQSIPDNPPVIAVTSPLQRELRLNRDARLPITYHAEDDHGLTAALIIFTIPGMTNDLIRSLPFPAIQPESGAPATLTGDTLIVLDDPLFNNPPRLSFRIRAVDNLPGSLSGPQSSDSESVMLILDNQAASWTEQVLTSQDKVLEQGLKQVKQKLTSAQEQARALNDPLAKQPELTDSTTRQIDTLQDTLASADNTLRNIATDIDNGFFESLSSNLTALAESHVGKAENMAGQIRLVDTPAERVAINSNITAEITNSLAMLEHTIQDHESARTAVRRAVELDQLAEKQAALAQARQEAEKAPPIPATNNTATAQADTAAKEWKQEQEQVAKELAKMARETPGSAVQVASAISNATSQAATQAAELANRQTDLAALTKETSDRLLKLDGQWHDLAQRQNLLADLARNEPLAVAQNESMRNAAREMETNKKEEALKTQLDVVNALKESAEKQQQAASEQQTVAQQPARLAEAAAKLAEQATRNAGQSAEQAKQAAQQAEQQAATAKQVSEKSDRAADQAEQQTQQAKGKADEQDLSRAAELARQNAETAQQSEADAREAADLSKQAAQAAEKQSQKTQQAAEATKNAAQAAVDQIQKAAKATTPRAAEQAQIEAAKEAASATDNAVAATDAALEARKFAAEARHQTDAYKLAELARQQVELRRETAQNESLLKNTRDLQSVKKTEPAPTNQPKAKELSSQTASQLAAQEAQEADKLAHQAAQIAAQAAKRANQAAERASQSTRQAEQQAAAAKQANESSKEAAEKTTQQAQQSKGKPNEQEQNRAAELARQNAQAAQQIEGEAREAAQQARQATQSATQQAQKAERAAQDSQLAAQQATEQAKKAAAATSALALKQAQAETSKAAAAAKANALTAAEAALEAGKFAAEARQQTDAFKVAELARLKAGQRNEIAKNEAVQNAARDLDGDKKTQMPDRVQEAGKPDPARELAARTADLKADQQATGNPRPDDPTAKAATQQAARQAQEASNLAQQAAQNAGQAVEKTKQAAQQADQQAASAKQAAQNNAQKAEQAAQQAQPSKGKANEQDLNRTAEVARQNAQTAQHQEAAATEAAQQAKKAVQAAEQIAQKAQEAARITQQAAQQAAEQSQKAASASSKQAAEQAQTETAKAATSATTKAMAAAEAALEASEIAARANLQNNAVKLSELARQQDELRREGSGLIAEKQAAETTLRENLARQLTGQQRKLADNTESLARELNKEPPPTRPATQATHAANMTGQAAEAMKQGNLPKASASAMDASQAMAQLAQSLQNAALSTAPARLDKRAEFARLAQQAETLAKQQEQMGRTMDHLAANQPLAALQAQQDLLGGDIKDLTQDAQSLRAQADEVLAPSQAGAQTAQAAQELAQADQSSERAAKQMEEAAEKKSEAGQSPSMQKQQQATGQALQNQQGAARSLQQASSRFQQAAKDAGAFQAAPPSTPPSASVSPAAQEAIAQAYQAAKQAAQNTEAAAAAQSASQLAQAAQEAVADAQARGANARPATLQSASLNGGGLGEETEQPAEGTPSFARRMGLKLQDWLRLHGEVKDDVLQAVNTEGPEEYRPIIQKYFREVSGHGEQE